MRHTTGISNTAGTAYLKTASSIGPRGVSEALQETTCQLAPISAVKKPALSPRNIVE